MILDNVESILPPPAESAAAGARAYEEEFQRALFARCRALLERSPGSRLVLTSREVPPVDSGFHAREQVLEIGRLGRREGIELVARVLAARQAGGASVDPKALEAQREEEIGRLVELVHGHARALVLLTPELADKGLNATTDELVEIMATMDARAGAGRESSLFASVELGLRRLPPGVRERILPLGVVEGGGCILAVRGILEVDAEECWRLCQTLHSVGLAEIVAVVPDPRRPSDVYLRLDPALAPALLRELRRDPGGEVAARNRWMQAYHALTSFLYRQRSTEIHLAVRLTALELPNLLGALRRLAADQSASPHDVIEVATSLESLTRFLHRPAAQREVARLRASAAATLVDAPWSHAAFVAQHQAIEALWAAGQSSRAVELSRDLLDRSVAAGPQAFPEADYDIALARLTLGRSLEMSGQTAEALEILATAREQFDRLARAGGDEAARMASVCLAESADCLLDAGKLDAAAGLYEEAIRRARDGGRRRSVAVGTGQLGAVRLRQRNYIEALRLYGEAMELFKDLDELKSVATCLHQIGIAHQGNGDPDAAEQHYLRSLAINVQTRTTAGEAGSRLQLGSLYSRMPGRLEDAAVFFQHASDLYVQIEDLAGEGKSRNNLASTLIRLGRHDAARPEITRAIECQSRLGPSAEPWKTWMILANLETAVGDAEAARRARERALRAYADARRQGWQITQGAGAPLCDMAFQVLAQTPQHTAQTQAQFVALAASGDTPPHLKALVAQLVRLLDGVRDDSLWRSPDLHYNDAAEILLLLERLERGDVAGSPAAPEMPADPGLRADPRRSADPDLPADPGPPIAAAAEPSIDQLLDALRAIAAGNNLDLATMSPQERVAFVAQVFLHNAGRTFESLDDAEKRALVAQATHLAERLPPKTA
ncbi:MAG: tetratricopeptide repeat protein [Phycisphaerales bacterium]